MNDMMCLNDRLLCKMWFWNFIVSLMMIIIDDDSLVILIWWFGDHSCWFMTCELWNKYVLFEDVDWWIFGDTYDCVWW